MTFTKSQLELFMEFIGHRIPLNEQPKHVLFTKEELDMLSMNAYYGPMGIIKCRDKDTFYIEEDVRKLGARIEKLEKTAPSHYAEVEMITDSEIEAALKLCEAATPGECKITMYSRGAKHKDQIVSTEFKDTSGFSLQLLEGLPADIELAFAARTLLPKALQEIKDLRLTLTQVQHNAMIDRHDGAEMAKLRAENERLRNEPPDVAETRKALAEGEVLLENIKLRTENAKLLRVKEAAAVFEREHFKNNIELEDVLPRLLAALKALDEEGK